ALAVHQSLPTHGRRGGHQEAPAAGRGHSRVGSRPRAARGDDRVRRRLRREKRLMRIETSSVAESGRDVALMLTRRCNMACGHCSVESGPGVRGEPSETELLEHVRQAARAGVRWIRMTGGEPMLRGRTLLRLLRECQRLGVRTSMSTNGFW